jgi:hypothetical protein
VNASVKMAMGVQNRRNASSTGLPSYLYNNVWRKSNIFYLTYIFAGCVVLEAVYGFATNALWESANRGVSIKHDNIIFISTYNI